VGHAVTVVDRDAAAVAAGARQWPGVRFEAGDMRDLSAHAGAFDVVLCLWQSFGSFDEATNRAVLAGMAACLRPGGRLILDLITGVP
jgi:SAM-dependent methyltransferase